MATTSKMKTNRRSGTRGTTTNTGPDWMPTLMRNDPEFTLTITAKGRTLHQIPISAQVIKQLAADTHALRSLGPIVRDQLGEETTSGRRVA